MSHTPELLLVSWGMLLRWFALRSYRPGFGYDFFEHELTINWWAHHFQMPPLLLSRGTYHPQLYYLLCGLARRAGASMEFLQAASVVTGCARLLLMWWAAERYLKRRSARLVALGLAVSMPVALEMDVMVTQEPLSNLVALLFVIAVVELCSASPSQRLRRALVLGTVAGLGLLIKVSNLVLLAVLAAGALLDLVQHPERALRKRVRRLGPWVAAASLALTIAAPQYVYNQREYGKALLDGWYRRPTVDTIKAAVHRQELLDRRTVGYVLGFNTDVVRFPYVPMGTEPAPRFWPTLIATSFSDYYNYRFGPTANDSRAVRVHLYTVARRAIFWGGGSVASGIGIAIVTVLGAGVILVRTLRRREVARPTVLLVPALGALGALYFAIQYPYDFEGVVKGHYLHFATFPLYAVFGASVSFLLRRRLSAPLGWLSIALLIFPAAYSALCVFK